MTTPATVYDRIRLACPGRNLVIEYIDGYCEERDEWLDEWRLIDLNTGEVFAKSPTPQDITPVASEMTRVEGSPKPEYVPAARKYIAFKDVPLADKLRHIQSLAQDLEHDLKLEGSDQCPLEAAMKEYQTRFGHRCWYQEENGEYEIDIDVEQ
jgi:hypothetical protein